MRDSTRSIADSINVQTIRLVVLEDARMFTTRVSHAASEMQTAVIPACKTASIGPSGTKI